MLINKLSMSLDLDQLTTPDFNETHGACVGA